MQKVLVSGSAGFIGGYLVEELLARGYAVVGIDNFSKYGKVTKSYDDNPNYELVEGDARMEVNYSLEPWELKAGFILTCQARPVSDKVVVDYDHV